MSCKGQWLQDTVLQLACASSGPFKSAAGQLSCSCPVESLSLVDVRACEYFAVSLSPLCVASLCSLEKSFRYHSSRSESDRLGLLAETSEARRFYMFCWLLFVCVCACVCVCVCVCVRQFMSRPANAGQEWEGKPRHDARQVTLGPSLISQGTNLLDGLQ